MTNDEIVSILQGNALSDALIDKLLSKMKFGEHQNALYLIDKADIRKMMCIAMRHAWNGSTEWRHDLDGQLFDAFANQLEIEICYKNFQNEDATYSFFIPALTLRLCNLFLAHIIENTKI